MAEAITYDTVAGVPKSLRGGGASHNPEWDAAMRNMPAPVPAKGKNGQPAYSSFFIAAPVASSITDAKERDKAARANCKKLATDLSNLGRSLAKEDPSLNFTYRTTRQTDGDPFSPWGVKVYRVPTDFDKGGPKRG